MQSFDKACDKTFVLHLIICIKYQLIIQQYFLIGCGNPPTPSQSTLQCARGVGSCFVTCKPGHALPDGRQRIVMRCENGQWQVCVFVLQLRMHIKQIVMPSYISGNILVIIQCIFRMLKLLQDTQTGVVSSVPDCLPVCTPACQNNGVCVHPGQCSCQVI